MVEDEEWRAVPGYEGLYEASSKGRVRSLDRELFVARSRRNGGSSYRRQLKGRVLTLNSTLSNGYLGINLSLNGKGKMQTVHVVVCATFHGPRPPGMVVAHTDGNKLNNAASNLRYATYKENAADAVKHGAGNAGTSNGQAKLSEAEVRAIRRAPDSIEVKALAAKYQVTTSCIRLIRFGDRWKSLEL